MDYEIAYKEALNRAKLLKDNPEKVVIEKYKGSIHASEYIFPELRESEDMKIKKELIDYIKSFPQKNWMGHDKEDVIVWLEKNGEQKTIEEVNGEDYGIDALWHAQRILEKTLGSVDGYQSDDGILEHKAAITIVKKLYEQKTVEWNEEDYNAIEAIACHLDNTDNEGMGDTLRNIRDKYYKTSLQTNEHAWLYLVSDVLTWKDGIGQYLDDPRVQELAKKLCSEYAQKLYNSAQDVAFGQKPTNKVEPKFKVGDWIIQEYVGVYKVIEICKSWYEVIDDEDNHYSISFDKEGMCHLWTVKDAKEGDVLSYVTDEEDLWIMIYQSLYEPYEGHVHYHALLVNDNFGDKGTCCICIDDLKPATKEQRDILFKKMKENGYEWDSEKKEAIRIY